MKLPRTIKYRGHLYWKQEGARTVRESDVEDVDAKIKELEADLEEQCKLLGKSAQRETKLLSEIAELEKENLYLHTMTAIPEGAYEAKQHQCEELKKKIKELEDKYEVLEKDKCWEDHNLHEKPDFYQCMKCGDVNVEKNASCKCTDLERARDAVIEAAQTWMKDLSEFHKDGLRNQRESYRDGVSKLFYALEALKAIEEKNG